jgi:hydrophobic/amphiphilic exporter-1 (mainly G- bacteria), HAE1 family
MTKPTMSMCDSAPEYRNSPQDLERIPFSLASADGSTKTVRLGQIAAVEETTGSNQINRRDLMREVTVNANASRRSAGEISKPTFEKY